MNEKAIIQGLLSSGKFKLLYSIEETATLLNCGVRRVNDLIREGQLNFYQNGIKKKSIPLTEILIHISENTRGRRVMEVL